MQTFRFPSSNQWQRQSQSNVDFLKSSLAAAPRWCWRCQHLGVKCSVRPLSSFALHCLPPPNSSWACLPMLSGSSMSHGHQKSWDTKGAITAQGRSQFCIDYKRDTFFVCRRGQISTVERRIGLITLIQCRPLTWEFIIFAPAQGHFAVLVFTSTFCLCWCEVSAQTDKLRDPSGHAPCGFITPMSTGSLHAALMERLQRGQGHLKRSLRSVCLSTFLLIQANYGTSYHVAWCA